MNSCALSPTDKKAYAKDVGQILVHKYGKQKFYTPRQVKQASSQSRYTVDWHCWAMCLYSSPADFNDYHAATGENCDYAAMKAEMATALTDGASESWFDFDLSWLEWPDFDLPSIFDIFD